MGTPRTIPSSARRPAARSVLVVVMIAALVGMAAPAQAATSTVTSLADSGPGSLRAAILEANTAPGEDTIDFSVTGTITLASALPPISETLTIDGPGATNLTISGNYAHRALNVGAGVTAHLRDLTMANGRSGGAGGGAIYNSGTLVVSDTTFSSNNDYGGPGSNGHGGAIYNSGTLSVARSSFSGNVASSGYGGAIFNTGTLSVEDSTFSTSSVSSGYGGAIHSSGTLSVARSTFSGNTARFGGGISNSGGTADVTNSTFSGNSGYYGTGNGGGIFNNAPTFTVTNSTFSGNSSGSGGGVSNWSGTVTLKNTIVADSPSGGNCGGTITDGEGNLQYPGTTCGATISTADPLLAPAGLQYNGGLTKTIALQSASPAIDAAAGSACPATDQRGLDRPQRAGCDIGSFELESLLVVTNTNDSGSGSLREAIAAANATPGADTITFAPWVGGTITLTSGQLTVTDAVTVAGPGPANLTISGNNAGRVFWVNWNGTLDLRDVTVANGSAACCGGVPNYGGGIYNHQGTLNVSNTVFTANSAYDGGAIANFGTLTVSNSTFTNQSVGWDAGIGNWGSLTITESTFASNSVTYVAGAIGNWGGSASITNSTFSGNSAGLYAGAILNYNGTLTVGNSTISGNSAGSIGGGGVYNYGGTSTIANSTISGNSGSIYGGALHNVDGYGNATLIIKNSIVANSPAGGNCSGTMTDQGGNLQYPGTTCGATITSGDPLLDPAGLQDNGGPTKTIALQSGSPAINAAVAANSPATDQRGVSRPQGAGYDIGAYEFESTNTPPVAVDDSYSTVEDTALTVPASTGVLANDTDADEDSLAAVLDVGPAHAASFTLNADGSFSYTPSADFNGSDSFTYKADDGTDRSEVATATITIDPANDKPDAPTGLGQFRAGDDSAIAVGGSTTGSSVVFKGTVSDPIEQDTVKLTVEVKPVGTPFDGSGLVSGTFVASGGTAEVTATDLPPGPRHWRARSVDDQGDAGDWAYFGDNAPGATDFEVHAITKLLYSGGQIVELGSSFTPAARLSSAAAACVGPGLDITFSLDEDPTTAALDDGPFELPAATTDSAGLGTAAPVSTAGWVAGVYSVKASFAATSSCEPSMDEATLTVASPGDAAGGGGWYTLTGSQAGSGRVNFGFTVHKVPKTTPARYEGQLLLINNGKWRLKGTIDSYLKLDTKGAASGTGNLYWWNPTLNGGLGDWVLSEAGVSFTISFEDAGKGGRKSGDKFGIHINHVVVAPPEPTALPNSSPQPLKGGDVRVR